MLARSPKTESSVRMVRAGIGGIHRERQFMRHDRYHYEDKRTQQEQGNLQGLSERRNDTHLL